MHIYIYVCTFTAHNFDWMSPRVQVLFPGEASCIRIDTHVCVHVCTCVTCVSHVCLMCLCLCFLRVCVCVCVCVFVFVFVHILR